MLAHRASRKKRQSHGNAAILAAQLL